MREIKFRAWLKNSKCMEYPKSNRHLFMWVEDENQPMDIMQYTGLKDKNGNSIYEGDLLNVFYTSGGGEHTHDCVYSVEQIEADGIRLKFQKLLWESYGYNQFPLSCELSVRYGHIDIIHDVSLSLELRDTYGSNHLRQERWKQHDKSRFFEKVGNAYENPDMLGDKKL